MSIYKQVLGDEFYRLHPMLQKRYEYMDSHMFYGKGKMKKIDGGPRWLFPLFWFGVRWKLLFPEHGKNIPFTIVNSPRTGENGEAQIHWERIFHFGLKKRSFNALMSLDQNRKVIKDYLGEPPLLYSDLLFNVSPEGDLEIRSKKQRLIMGKIAWPLPKIFQGLARITEKYVEENGSFSIKVVVQNPIIGRVFSYEGEVTSDLF